MAVGREGLVTITFLSSAAMAPLAQLVHEAGHTAVLLATGGELKHVGFGGGTPFLRFRIGACLVTVGLGVSLKFVWRPPPGVPGVGGQALRALGGILANVLASVLAWALCTRAWAGGEHGAAAFLFGFLLMNAMLALSEVIPRKREEDEMTDGWRLLGLLVPRFRATPEVTPRAMLNVLTYATAARDGAMLSAAKAQLAMNWAMLGEPDAARALYEPLPAEFPPEAEANVLRCHAVTRALLGVGAGAEDEALRTLGRGEPSDPSSPELLAELAEVAGLATHEQRVGRLFGIDGRPAGEAALDEQVAAWRHLVRAGVKAAFAQFVVGEVLLARLPAGDPRRVEVAVAAEEAGVAILRGLPTGDARDRVEERVWRMGRVRLEGVFDETGV